MMGALIVAIIEGLARAFKIIFGMDSPAKVTVIDERPKGIPPPDDLELLRSLGVRRDRGAASGNASSDSASGQTISGDGK